MTDKDSAEIEIEQVRRDTPHCERVIHLHSAGASLMPEPVYTATTRHLEREYRMGGYEAAHAASDAINALYREAAAMFGADETEIAFMENATAAWNSVFYGFARSLKPGERILTCTAEYASNYIAYLHMSGITGSEVVTVPDDEHGQIDCAALEAMIDERVRLISITHVPTNGGLVNPVSAVGEVARRHGIPFLLDTCQSAGQMPVDVNAIGCDALTLTGRKYLRGPRGTGVLVVRKDAMGRFPPATLDLWGGKWTGAGRFRFAAGARRYENFENNVAGQIGLGVALAYANRLGLDNIYRRIRRLADGVRAELAHIEGVTIRDKGLEQCGIVSFTHEIVDAETIRRRLAEAGINVGISHRPSTLIDMDQRGLECVVRCALHYFNTEVELATFCERLRELVRR